jgi:hypothetical protein
VEDDAVDEGASQLSTGAIAGIAVGSVIGVLALVTGVFMCLRRRRRTTPQGDEGLEVAGSMENLKRGPNYTYPAGRAPLELPTQHMATAEMDASGYYAATSTTGWKTPMQGREDSPTVMELPERKWGQTAWHELEGDHAASMASGTQTGTWQTGTWQSSNHP